jgi:F420 biosynthesis protein FbiB-like protein
VDRILRAACRAPSAHNRQPWRFVVVGQGAAREALIACLQSRLEQDLRADGVTGEALAARMAARRARLAAPALLVVLCLCMEDMDVYPDERRQSAERAMTEQSVALAGGQLLLAAHAEGLGACWLCAPLFAPQDVVQALGLPPAWEPRAAIALGHPLHPVTPGERRKVEEVTAWR